MSPVAAIDCGTNTIKLLILDETGTELAREMRVVRLGQDVDATGMLAPEALARTFAAIEEYVPLIQDHGVGRIRFVATSATRDASNAAAFAAGVRARLGVDPEVVSGATEAGLAFAGALGGLASTPRFPVVVLDIGGGSTELIRGSRAGEGPDAAYSMQIGSVRLTERFLRSDPPAPAELAAASRYVDEQLAACPVDPADAATLVGVAGTVTQLAVGALGLAAYDRAVIDQARIKIEDLLALVADLAEMTTDQRRALSWMHPGRADVIVAGGVILDRVLRRARVRDLVVSEADILDGIAHQMLA